MKRIVLLLCVMAFAASLTMVRCADSPVPSTGAEGLASLVNPMIGTAGGGNIFPGAVYPFGLIQWSPDTARNPGGYEYRSTTVTGFSLTHFSGRGVVGWTDVPFMPFVGSPATSPGTHWADYSGTFKHTDEQTSPGYYRVKLGQPDVAVEMTVTPRTGLGRFTFPASTKSTLLINTGGSRNPDRPEGTSVQVVGDRQITGSAASSISGVKYVVYFAAEFQQPFTSFGTWSDDVLTAGSRTSQGAHSGAYLVFDTTQTPQVLTRVGISFVSIENAQANLKAENPGWDFEAVKKAASRAWSDKLAAIRVEGGTPDEQTVFYTSFYHAMIHPNVWNDANGQYLGFDGKVHEVEAGHNHYENITTWDGWRNQITLLALVAPQQTTDIVRSLLTDAAQDPDGGLPRWQQSNSNSGGMVGDGPLVYVANAYAYGDRDFNTTEALAAMERDASDPATKSGGHSVRSGLKDYLAMGYVPRAASVTLEYDNDDFALAQFAKAMGHDDKYRLYLSHAQNWRNLFDKDAGGYIIPRGADGTFDAKASPSQSQGFVEGTSAQYTWMIPFNFRGLFDAIGGNAAVVERLDHHFTKLNSTGEYSWMGNEPEATAPWAYDFAGTPYRTQDVVRRIVLELFTNKPGGIPGNDDSGAMGSWNVFAMLGIYPEIPGVPGFVVGSPIFKSARMNLPGGHTLEIQAPKASDDNRYVQSLTVDGKEHNSPWIPWAEAAGGTVLKFSLASTPDKEWGAAAAAAPPSFDGTPAVGPAAK